MAVSLTTIYNQALGACGARNNISLPAEASRETNACNLWYETVRDQILSASRWPEATRQGHLAVLKEIDTDGIWQPGEPRPNYRFAYALPSDYLHPQWLTTFDRFAVMVYDDDQLALMTNTASAHLIYTARQTKLTLWGPQLRLAITLGLAAFICTDLTGKEKRALSLLERANTVITNAREMAANTNNEQYEVLPEWITARGYSDSQITRYFYPLGPLLAIAEIPAGVS